MSLMQRHSVRQWVSMVARDDCPKHCCNSASDHRRYDTAGNNARDSISDHAWESAEIMHVSKTTQPT